MNYPIFFNRQGRAALIKAVQNAPDIDDRS